MPSVTRSLRVWLFSTVFAASRVMTRLTIEITPEERFTRGQRRQRGCGDCGLCGGGGLSRSRRTPEADKIGRRLSEPDTIRTAIGKMFDAIVCFSFSNGD
jgi:hypothetical protein